MLSRVVIVSDVLNGGAETAYGRNSDYAFRLQRESSDSPWVLQLLVDLHATDAMVPPSIRMRLSDSLNPCAVLTHLRIKPLEQLIHTKGLAFKSAQYEQVGSDRLARLEFAVTPNESNAAETDIVQGLLWLDPEHMWCVRKGEFQLKSREGTLGKLSISIELRGTDDAGDLFIPRRIQKTERWNLPNGKESVFDVSVSLAEFSRELPPESDFHLTAFGLPEPEFAHVSTS